MKTLTTAQILAVHALFISVGIDKRTALYKTAQAAYCDIQSVALAIYLAGC